MSSHILRFLNILGFVALAAGFEITYPKPDDTVSVWNGAGEAGIPMTWTYNSTDDTSIPLYIYYIEVGPRGEEAPTKTWKDIDIKREEFNIQADFGIASSYMIRVIHGQNEYVADDFDISLTGNDDDESTPTTSSESSRTTTGSETSTAETETKSTPTATLITKPANTPTTTSDPTNPPDPTSTDEGDNPSGGLDTGAKAGIGVGVSAAAIIGLAAGFFFARSKKNRPEPVSEEKDTKTVPPHNAPAEVSADAEVAKPPEKQLQQQELDGNQKYELPSNSPPSELPA
ncbi:hypothetical protein FQN54_000694 [Arachnomyces sp. PD_36]|nr:hypothetical protein FQN54_000694 [Arachnomyces sp. PD_36]